MQTPDYISDNMHYQNTLLAGWLLGHSRVHCNLAGLPRIHAPFIHLIILLKDPKGNEKKYGFLLNENPSVKNKDILVLFHGGGLFFTKCP